MSVCVCSYAHLNMYYVYVCRQTCIYVHTYVCSSGVVLPTASGTLEGLTSPP